MFGINALVPFLWGVGLLCSRERSGVLQSLECTNWAEQDVCQACLMAGGQARGWSM